MTAEEEMLQYASDINVQVIPYAPFDQVVSAVANVAGTHAIGINVRALPTSADRAVALAHEIGHIETGALYSALTPFETRERCEHKARKWSFANRLPFDRLSTAVHAANGRLWEVAEDFGVTTDFVCQAIEHYESKGLFVKKAIK